MAPDAETHPLRTFLSLFPEATEQLAEGLGRQAFAGLVVVLEGELGAGKTCFARGFARGLGVIEPVSSPTFALMNRHEGRLPLLHFDAWMEGRERALLADGGSDLVGEEVVTLIEWGERVAEQLGGAQLHVRLAHVGGPDGLERREIQLSAHGSCPRILALVETLEPLEGHFEEVLPE